jgi:hypothetical protein
MMVAAKLNRSLGAIRARASKLGLSWVPNAAKGPPEKNEGGAAPTSAFLSR